MVGVLLRPERNLRVLQELLQDPEQAARVVIAAHGEGIKALLPLQGDISIALLCHVRILNKSLKKKTHNRRNFLCGEVTQTLSGT